jgi:hypothetical protein
MFLLDMVDNLPRLRISDSLMKVFLFILRSSGARDVPSIGELRRVQKDLRSSGAGVPTIPFKSALGNVFHVNDPRSIIAKVSVHIVLYSEFYLLISFVGLRKS